MNEAKILELQMQLKENQADMMDFVKDLDSWGNDMKKKDEQLKHCKDDKQTVLPPVRNALTKKRKKKKVKPADTSASVDNDKKKSDVPRKIRGYDYRAWDKFDVDKACQDVEQEDRSSSSDYETDEEAEEQRKKQIANEYKEQGNSLFKSGKFDESIECYTRAIDLDPQNAVHVANRAMASLKQQRYATAELDCTIALSLDPTYIKAYSRRGTARLALKKYELACEDFQQVLKLEPNNKQASTEIKNIQQMLNPVPELAASLEICDKGIISPVYKSPAERSKKPLRRMKIEEIGVEETQEAKLFKARASAASADKTTAATAVGNNATNFDKFLQLSTTTKSCSASNGVEDFGGSRTLDNSGRENEKDRLIEEVMLHEGEKFSNRSPGSGDYVGDSDVVKVQSALDEERKKDKGGQRDAAMEGVQESERSGMGRGSETRAVGGSSRKFSAPNSSFQFQADWKLLKNSASDDFFQYFKQIDPDVYQRIFGEALEADMLSKIFFTLQTYYVTNGLNIYPVLKQLTTVKRFLTITMFLSNKDKQVLKVLFAHLGSHSEYTQDDIEALRRLYDI